MTYINHKGKNYRIPYRLPYDRQYQRRMLKQEENMYYNELELIVGGKENEKDNSNNAVININGSRG